MKQYSLPTTIHELLETTEEKFGNKAFVYQLQDAKYESISYREFIADVKQVASCLIDKGYKDSHIMLYGANSYEWLVSYVAVSGYVGTCVCANKDWKQYDLENASRVVHPELVLCDVDLFEEAARANKKSVRLTFADLMEQSRHVQTSALQDYRRDKDDTMAVVFTTGTTSLPKAVPLTFANLLANVDALSQRILPTSIDRYYLFLPLHHIYSQTCIALAALWYGSELYLSQDHADVRRELLLAKPTILPGVPLFFERIIASITPSERRSIDRVRAVLNTIHAPNGLRKKVFSRVHAALGGNIRVLISGAAKLDRDHKKLFKDMGFTLVEGYGMTEASGVVAAEFPGDAVLESSGRVLEHIDIKIDQPNARGEGEICIRGDNITKGYLQSGVIDRSPFDSDGYYHTGDMGNVDATRNLFIKGRKDNVLVLSSGESVLIQELKSLLFKIKGVEKVYLFEKDGYVAATIFTKRTYAHVSVAIRQLNTRLPRYKQIHSFDVVNDYTLSRMKE